MGLWEVAADRVAGTDLGWIDFGFADFICPIFVVEVSDVMDPTIDESDTGFVDGPHALFVSLGSSGFARLE